MELMQDQIKSPLGTIYLVSSEKGLKSIDFKKPKMRVRTTKLKKAQPILDEAKKQLVDYFANRRKKFNLPLDLDGSDFQKKVWLELSKIPYGKTCSYKEVADKIQSPKAYRAVGTANGKNPLPIIIPCHRVISANGSLGGYSGGLSIKIKLLQLEGLNNF
ncbi:MAG: methylated-DNA--[protein]-cysteine S-methyltransferase [Bdellovibrionales bacterium]|nr:methylated-DNA--[protein]-cysteine S-methyltransferase [Bdellovibrionales bacterium]